ncbi:MAG TPA: cell envelope integrity protein TolA [Sinorhizobium sp.]|nr:cell envelope integrity protein TolA [Sinorhizobium sp.]
MSPRNGATSAFLLLPLGAVLALSASRALAEEAADPEVGRIISSCIQKNWSVPLEQTDQKVTPATIRFRLRPDGSLDGAPEIVASGNSKRDLAMAKSAVRAVVRCAPIPELTRFKYETWKELEINFDPGLE